MNVEQILSHLVAFDTVSHNPNRACIDFIRNYLDGFGVPSEIVASDDGGKACLWAKIGSSGKSGVALAGHTDVVPVDGQKWTSDPFTLTERDGKLYARGAADMKGFIACALAFVPEFLAANTGTCFHLAFTSDEETDMSGATRLTDHLMTQGIKPLWIWVGEPTSLSIVNQHKGVSAWRTSFAGQAHHSSQPDKGVNAISLAAHFVDIIEDTARAHKNKPYESSRFDPAYTTFNLGMIEGGAAANIIAEKCELLWEVRAHPGDVARDIVAAIEKKNGYAPQQSKTCVCYDIPPFLATPDNPGEKTLKRVLKCDHTHAVGFATEAGVFQKLGAPAVVCGPGSIDQAHQPDEFIDKSQLVACVDLMRQVLLSSTAS